MICRRLSFYGCRLPCRFPKRPVLESPLSIRFHGLQCAYRFWGTGASLARNYKKIVSTRMAHATKGSFPQLAVVFATCSICDKGSQRRFAAMGPNDGRADKAVIDHVGEDPVLSNGSTPSRKSLQSKNGQGGEPTRFAVDVCLSLREVKRVELVTRKKSQSSKSTTDNLAKRMPADKRRMSMLDDAAVHFAEHGFAATTRDIAGALGVTHPNLQAFRLKGRSGRADIGAGFYGRCG